MHCTSAVSLITLCLVLLLPTYSLALVHLENCTALPPHNASSIQDLRPGDIKVIMAMGDSITTGFGVRAAANESMGTAFSMGGDPNTVTIANFLQLFNPALVGASLGTYPAEICYGATCPSVQYITSQDVNNAATSGAMVTDLGGSQITYLLRQVNQNPLIDVQNDWKVLTIMIGMNDLCASCTFNLPFLDPADYQNNLMATLERVRTSIPRTFVNLVAGFNVSQAYELSQTADRCTNLTRSLFISCDCIFQPANGAIREQIDSAMTQFNAAAQSVAQYYQLQEYDDFAVVMQPFATETYISDLPSSFLSHYDCFHPSLLGQEAMAVALWNNMLSPASAKQTFLNMTDSPICPTPDTLLYTY